MKTTNSKDSMDELTELQKARLECLRIAGQVNAAALSAKSAGYFPTMLPTQAEQYLEYVLNGETHEKQQHD